MCCSKEELGAVGSIIAQCPSIQQLLVIDVDQEKPTAQVLEKVSLHGLPCRQICLLTNASGCHRQIALINLTPIPQPVNTYTSLMR